LLASLLLAAAPAFRFGQSSTRFLGDLYQDLSEDVRKKYALLQTPEFVEEFILDRTLEPALAERPLAIGDCTGMGDAPLEDLARSGRFTPYTALCNVTGSPAISVPLYQRPDDDPDAGLPLGIQLIGQPLGEGTLLAVAAQLEAANPWAGRRPEISGA